MKQTQTKKCVRCGKAAKLWRSHVVNRKGKRILAGWCSDRCRGAWLDYRGLYRAQSGEEQIPARVRGKV